MIINTDENSATRYKRILLLYTVNHTLPTSFSKCHKMLTHCHDEIETLIID